MCKHSGKCMHKQGAQALRLSRSMLSRHAWSYFLQQPNILYYSMVLFNSRDEKKSYSDDAIKKRGCIWILPLFGL